MRRRWIAAPLVCVALGLAAAILITGRGSIGLDEGELTEVIERSFLEPDPRNCTTIYSPHLLRWMTQEASPRRAQATCRLLEEAEAELAADRVELLEIDGEDDELASATVRVHGGSWGGTTLEFGFVSREHGWLIDELRSVKIDRPAFEAAGREALAAQEFRAADASCMLDELFADGPDRLASEIVRDAGYDGSTDAIVACLDRSELIAVMLRVLRSELDSEISIPPRFADCVEPGLRGVSRQFTLRELAAPIPPRAFERKLKQVAKVCIAATIGDPVPRPS